MMRDANLVAVRERERESRTLTNQGMVLFNSLTHTQVNLTNRFNAGNEWSEINYLSCISNSKWNYKVRDG